MVNNLEAVEKVIERIRRALPARQRIRGLCPTIDTADLLRAFRAYDSAVEELRSEPKAWLPLKPGDRCPTCGWTVPTDMEHHNASTRVSPSGHVYAAKPREVKPKPDTLSEDEYRLVMLRAVRSLCWSAGGRATESPVCADACSKAIQVIKQALGK